MERVLLGNVLHIDKGRKPTMQSKEPQSGYLPYVDIKAFEKGIIDNYATAEKSLLCEDGDLLIVCDGSRSGLTGKAIKGVVGSTLAKIFADGLSTEYLRYFIQSIYTLLNTQKKGTGTPHLNVDIIKKAEIILPPLPEQERIAARIEELFFQLDNGVETLKKAKQQLAVYRQAVLKEVFEGCKETKTVEQVCSVVTDGDHFPPPKSADGIPFIIISNISNKKITWSNTYYVSQDYYNSIGEKRTPVKGDVLYTVTGSYGIPILVDFDKAFCFQRHIALLRPNEHILQKYLYYVMQSPYVYQQATEKATGTAQKTVTLSVLRKIVIPYCKNNEQTKVVSIIENRLSIYNSIEQTIDTTLQQAEVLRQSILKKAFEGGLI